MKILVEHYYWALIFENEKEALDQIKSIQEMIDLKKETGEPYPGISAKVADPVLEGQGFKHADIQTDRILAGLRLAPKEVKQNPVNFKSKRVR